MKIPPILLLNKKIQNQKERKNPEKRRRRRKKKKRRNQMKMLGPKNLKWMNSVSQLKRPELKMTRIKGKEIRVKNQESPRERDRRVERS